MKKCTTPAVIDPAAIVEDAWQDVGASFERFCLATGVATLAGMMEEDASRLCGPRYGREHGRDGHRWGRTRGKSASTAARSRSNGLVSLPAPAARWPCRVGKRPCRRTCSASGP